MLVSLMMNHFVYLCIHHLWIVRKQLFGSINLTNAEPFDNLMNLTKPIHVKMLIVDTRNPQKNLLGLLATLHLLAPFHFKGVYPSGETFTHLGSKKRLLDQCMNVLVFS